MFTATRAAAAAVVVAALMLTAGVVSAAATGTASVDAPIPTPMVSAAAPEVPQASPVTTTVDSPWFCINGPAPASGCSTEPIDLNCTCPNVYGADGLPLQITPGKQVVLLLHGVNQNHKVWNNEKNNGNKNKNENLTLAETLDRDPNYVVGRFDYGGFADGPSDHQFTEAVDRLRLAIKCLAEKSGRKVSLVGYSKGALVAQGALTDATRYIKGIRLDSKGVADKVEGLVSIGTPWKLENNLAPELKDKVANYWKLTTPIPSSVPVLPVGAKIEANDFGNPRYRECPIKFDSLGELGRRMATQHGDGCFEHNVTTKPDAKNVIAPPLTLECTDQRKLVLGSAVDNRSAPMELKGNDNCKEQSFTHSELQKNKELVPRVTMQLQLWRAAAAKNPLSAGGCGNDSNPQPVKKQPQVDIDPKKQPHVGTGGVCDPPKDSPESFHPHGCRYPGTEPNRLVCPHGYHPDPSDPKVHTCFRDKGESSSRCPNGMVGPGPNADGTKSGCWVPGHQPPCPDTTIAHKGEDECQPNPPTGHPGPCPPPMVGPGPSADGTDSGCWLPGVPCVAPMVGPGSDEHGMGCWLPGQGPVDPPIQVPPVQVDPVQPAPVPAQTPCPPGMTVPGATHCFGVISPNGTPQEQAAKRQQEQQAEQAAKRQQEQSQTGKQKTRQEKTEQSQTGKQKTQQEKTGKKPKCDDGFVYDASLKECVQQ